MVKIINSIFKICLVWSNEKEANLTKVERRTKGAATLSIPELTTTKQRIVQYTYPLGIHTPYMFMYVCEYVCHVCNVPYSMYLVTCTAVLVHTCTDSST